MVVDCAAVIDALTSLAGTDSLVARLAAEDLHTPALLDYEVVSVLRGLTLGRHLSGARAEDLLTDFGDLRMRRWSSSGALRRRTLQLRDNVSAYDAAYLALAEALDCPLLTRDARLARSGGHAVHVEVL